MPLLYTYPPLRMLLLFGVAGVGLHGALRARRRRAADDLLRDPRYAEAKRIVVATSMPDDTEYADFRKLVKSEAVQHLVTHGVDEATARRSVALFESIYRGW